ncbi:hypothetical protein MRX96_047893 [Rhipicephalus microplus]
MVSLRTTVLFSENVQKLLALLKLGHLVHLLLDVGVAPPRLPTHRMTELCIPSIQSITNQFIFVLRQGYRYRILAPWHQWGMAVEVRVRPPSGPYNWRTVPPKGSNSMVERGPGWLVRGGALYHVCYWEI